MPAATYPNAKSAPENLRSWRTFTHQNFPDHWGKTLEIYNIRNWWRIGIESDTRIHMKEKKKQFAFEWAKFSRISKQKVRCVFSPTAFKFVLWNLPFFFLDNSVSIVFCFPFFIH